MAHNQLYYIKYLAYLAARLNIWLLYDNGQSQYFILLLTFFFLEHGNDMCCISMFVMSQSWSPLSLERASCRGPCSTSSASECSWSCPQRLVYTRVSPALVHITTLWDCSWRCGSVCSSIMHLQRRPPKWKLYRRTVRKMLTHMCHGPHHAEAAFLFWLMHRASSFHSVLIKE